MTKEQRKQRDLERFTEMKAREDELRKQGFRFIAGIDEVGRGPLAGAVYTACVILPDDFAETGINDSKKLTPARREALSESILEGAVAWGIGIADSEEIDRMNILEATKTAMTRAVEECGRMLLERTGSSIDLLLVDAVKLDTGLPCNAVIKGDEKYLSIAAASIVAKVARDAYMTEMDSLYPGYDFASNKGYGTARHYEGLRSLGYTPIHRRSFLRKFENENQPVNEERYREEKESMSAKLYAVRKGRRTGIFTSWDICREQVTGFSGAEYRSFTDRNKAIEYLNGNQTDTAVADGAAIAYVDGSYNIRDGRYSCGVVLKYDEDGRTVTTELSRAFDDKENAKQRNVAGEIMGAEMAIDFCLNNGIPEVHIYYDYEGVGKWADGLWKANNPLTMSYKAFVASAREHMSIRFVKVRAHSGNEYNDRADLLAKAALGMKQALDPAGR